MKIVILGSHGTGKSTLAQRLHGYLLANYSLQVNSVSLVKNKKIKKLKEPIGSLHWEYLPEAPFEALQRGFTMNKETSLESELWIVAHQLEMELRSAPWVADKCLIDILAYARYLFKSEPEFLSIIERIIKKNINYNLVIYLPTGEFPIEDNSLRLMDTNFQKDIDTEILKIMNEMDVSYYTITGSKDERFNAVKEIIDKML